MEVLFEMHPAVYWRTGRVDVVQNRARIDPDPVLVGDSAVDGGGASIYGTVLHDGGVYRMWYQATPRDWGEDNMALVCYAESDDGREWRKPELGLVEYGDGPNNLCNLGVHCPSVFIDPDSPASHRYRATGCVSPSVDGCHKGAEHAGYYTFHSQDGLHWEMDSTTPTWDSVDVITSIYHPGQRRGIAVMKFNPVLRGFMRRVFYSADFRDGSWSEALPALIPDEFDDICAVTRGFASGDYYGTAMLPAGTGTVAMIWQFRHRLPRPGGGQASGMYGVVDISLAYQAAPGACWQHQSGRPDFVSASDQPWAKGGIYSANSPVEVGDEHWLYVCGSPFEHAYSVNEKGETDERLLAERTTAAVCSRIGVARFPKYRLFGFRAHPEGALCLKLKVPAKPWDMYLNYECEHGGHIEVLLQDALGTKTYGTAARLEGDAAEAKVMWDDGARRGIAAGGEFAVQLIMRHATVYAFETR
ncbi:MAG: hypothetical protein HQ559_01420 [Lentisphaerae bacterium]|nr:hypothetical protein [Lentisphaerota bacterium]